jgi:hypothetical protein
MNKKPTYEELERRARALEYADSEIRKREKLLGLIRKAQSHVGLSEGCYPLLVFKNGEWRKFGRL